jgi:hypothetical protein
LSAILKCEAACLTYGIHHRILRKSRSPITNQTADHVFIYFLTASKISQSLVFAIYTDVDAFIAVISVRSRSVYFLFLQSQDHKR